MHNKITSAASYCASGKILNPIIWSSMHAQNVILVHFCISMVKIDVLSLKIPVRFMIKK